MTPSKNRGTIAGETAKGSPSLSDKTIIMLMEEIAILKSEVAELRKQQKVVVEQFPGICGNCTKFHSTCKRPGVIECPDYKALMT